ncbi:protein MEI2-like 7 [Andrographis paniculata]|uniref:protein MEI2-like 7 n=1 Tax=Andrographis paniculata TaxID=175694 RepID=UPI0021E92DB6|nr:protein MEI2-like 7 [Andrographis paniculata]
MSKLNPNAPEFQPNRPPQTASPHPFPLLPPVMFHLQIFHGFYYNPNQQRAWTQENIGGRYIQRSTSRHQVMPLEVDPHATTVVMKNIPYDCKRSEIIDVLDGFCLKENSRPKKEGSSQSPEEEEEPVICSYDYVYEPFDFKTNKGRGFAFVNFTNAATVRKFSSSFQGTFWKNCNGKNWKRPIEIAKAKIQGKEALVEKASQSLYDCDTDEFLPVTFEPARDGSGNPVEMTVVGNRRSSSGVGSSSSSGTCAISHN